MEQTAPQQSESTAPFSAGHFVAVERMLQSPNRHGNDVRRFDSEPEIPARQDLDIRRLDLDGLDCRLVLYPADRSGLFVSRGDWVRVVTKAEESQRGYGAFCIAVPQGPEDIGTDITSPVRCSFYYDTGSDQIQLANKGDETLIIQNIAVKNKPEEVPFGDWFCLVNGFWQLSIRNKPLVQLAVFGSGYSLIAEQRPEVLRLVGTKRNMSGEGKIDSKEQPVALAITRPIHSITETSSGETVTLRDSTGEYSFTRLKQIAKTNACQVFQAKHSWYDGRVTVVKALRFRDGEKPQKRKETWLHEYQIHKELRFVSIVNTIKRETTLTNTRLPL